MKIIGLIGGTSWHSTIDYYRIINEQVNNLLGGNTSGKIFLYSVDYGEIVSLTQKGDWHGIELIISEAAQRLEDAGAVCILLCANTMHTIADKIQLAIKIPLLHIVDVVIKAIEEEKIKTVLLLGTKYTMQGSFYSERLMKNGIRVLIPDSDEIEKINNSIYNELGKGLLLPATKDVYLEIINKYIALGAEGVILGCTEIPLLIQQADCSVPVLNTTLLHASAAVTFAIE